MSHFSIFSIITKFFLGTACNVFIVWHCVYKALVWFFIICVCSNCLIAPKSSLDTEKLLYNQIYFIRKQIVEETRHFYASRDWVFPFKTIRMANRPTSAYEAAHPLWCIDPASVPVRGCQTHLAANCFNYILLSLKGAEPGKAARWHGGSRLQPNRLSPLLFFLFPLLQKRQRGIFFSCRRFNCNGQLSWFILESTVYVYISRRGHSFLEYKPFCTGYEYVIRSSSYIADICSPTGATTHD